jgi:hypothetical protein
MFIYVLVGLNVQIVFLFKRELLIKKESFLIISGINFILFLIGNIDESLSPFKIAFVSQLIFKLLLLLYKFSYKENPIDTFWVVNPKLMKDGVFNFLFWVLGVLIPTLLFL